MSLNWLSWSDGISDQPTFDEVGQFLTNLTNFWPTWPTFDQLDQLGQFLTNLTNFWRTWSSWSISDQLFTNLTNSWPAWQIGKFLTNVTNFWPTWLIFDQLDQFLTNLTFFFNQLDQIGEFLTNFWPTWQNWSKFEQLLTNLTNFWPTFDQLLTNVWPAWPTLDQLLTKVWAIFEQLDVTTNNQQRNKLNWIGAALATPTKITHIFLQMETMNRTIVTNFPCTYSVGYLWTLDYDNEPPIARQIELNRCSALAMPTKMQHITGGYEPKNCHKLSITCLVGYHWRLYHDNEPPTAKHMGLNQCSFGDANKNATYNWRLHDHQFISVHI